MEPWGVVISYVVLVVLAVEVGVGVRWALVYMGTYC